MKKIIGLCLSSLLTINTSFANPKMIVQITIDQFRGDLLERYQDKFIDNGFKFFMNHGLWYTNAHHPHANTTTCVGHATLATGTYPRYHGMIANQWFDTTRHKIVNCVADDKAKALPIAGSQGKNPGRSPKNLIASTFSDELVLAQKGRAFAVSYKDRGAITLAGHAGKAFWFDAKNGGFISSDYYYKKYPQWVSAWNAKHLSNRYHKKQWKLSHPKSQYLFADNTTYNPRFNSYGKTFPHHFAATSSARYFKTLMLSPIGDELTARFALEILNKEKLGKQQGKTDLLAISFSSNDAIGHHFGPNSLEAEENILRLDKTLARLIKSVDEQVGLDNVLWVLSADHGVTDTPEFLRKHHIDTGAVLIDEVVQKQINPGLKERFDLDANAISAMDGPYVYLNHQYIHNKGYEVEEVAHFIAEQLKAAPGMEAVFAFDDVEINLVAATYLSRKVRHMFVAGRVGDLYLIAKPYWNIIHADNAVKVNHGTPWNYDAFVPVIFAHQQIKGRQLNDEVETIDVAPTLANLLAIKKPSASVGKVLSTVSEYKTLMSQ